MQGVAEPSAGSAAVPGVFSAQLGANPDVQGTVASQQHPSRGAARVMDFADRIKELALRVPKQLEHIRTEEATKNALVMPFINALGYNVFDPREVTPELIADVGTKKGEKVDYAILVDGKPVMLFECKGSDCNLDHVTPTQLYRYFSVTPARLGILTNGVGYRFFSDLEAPNKMDSKPFFEIDMRALDDLLINELKKFAKGTFDLPAILASAVELKYTREIKRIMAQELQQPSEELVRFFVTRVYEGRVTQSIRGQFAEITKRALQGFIVDRVNDRLKSALVGEPEPAETASADSEKSLDEEGRVLDTTEAERDGYYIVRAILSEIVDAKRVVMRDQQSYCAVLLDDNNRKPICRLWFNTSRKYLGLFDEKKVEKRMPLGDITEIFRFAVQLKETVTRYLGSPAAPAPPATAGEAMP